jgi:hypothetical protein
MKNKIQIEVKNVYGVEKIYPVCSLAKDFSDLAGTKTLTITSLKIIKKMGYEIEVVSREWKLKG